VEEAWFAVLGMVIVYLDIYYDEVKEKEKMEKVTRLKEDSTCGSLYIHTFLLFLRLLIYLPSLPRNGETSEFLSSPYSTSAM
jgi:hypothetical protein